jgi:hypothetical protein
LNPLWQVEHAREGDGVSVSERDEEVKDDPRNVEVKVVEPPADDVEARHGAEELLVAKKETRNRAPADNEPI